MRPSPPEFQLIDASVKISLDNLRIEKDAMSKVRKTGFQEKKVLWMNWFTCLFNNNY